MPSTASTTQKMPRTLGKSAGQVKSAPLGERGAKPAPGDIIRDVRANTYDGRADPPADSL